MARTAAAPSVDVDESQASPHPSPPALSTPTDEPLTKNSTCWIPSASDASALTETTPLTVAPSMGAVTSILGGSSRGVPAPQFDAA